MAYRKRPDLAQSERAAIAADLRAEKRKAEISLMTLSLTCRTALAAGFTTQELGDTLGVSASTAARWARGIKLLSAK